MPASSLTVPLYYSGLCPTLSLNQTNTTENITTVIDQPSNDLSASAVADGEGLGRLLQEVETKTVTVLN